MPKQYGGPGPRLIYPSTALSLSLARCDPMAQLLFERMLPQADDQGRMIADPDVVRGQCIPLVKSATAAKVALWLDQLEGTPGEGMILRYEAEGHALLQILNWWEYQNGMRRAYPSRWPAPGEWSDRVFGLPSGAGNGAADTPAARGQGARKMPAQRGQSASTEPAERPGMPAQRGQSAERPRARRPAPGEPSRTEGTYVPRTELTPYPLSPDEADMHAEYLACLSVHSESTGRIWREEGTSRGVYLSKRQEGFTADDMEAASRGVALDAWFMGQNPDGVPKTEPATVWGSPKFQTFVGLGRGEIRRTADGPSRHEPPPRHHLTDEQRAALRAITAAAMQ